MKLPRTLCASAPTTVLAASTNVRGVNNSGQTTRSALHSFLTLVAAYGFSGTESALLGWNRSR
jgi:hypothetical protein